MTYYNQFKTPLLKVIWRDIRFTQQILLVGTLTFIALHFVMYKIAGASLEKFIWATTTLLLLNAALTIYLVYRSISVGFPNEESVSIENDALRIKYPYGKKSIDIPFSSIEVVRANFLNTESESSIHLKEKFHDKDISTGTVTINSIKPDEWQRLSATKHIPLILSTEIEEKVIEKTGLFNNSIVGDDFYVIRKDFANEDLKITEQELLTYASKSGNVELLGKEVFLNVDSKIQKTPYSHFKLATEYGNKALSYRDGVIIALYENSQSPVEIEEIADGLKAEFRNVQDA